MPSASDSLAATVPLARPGDSTLVGPLLPPSPFDPVHQGAGAAMRGGAVTIAGQGLRVVVKLVGTVALARLLLPADFGLVAMVAVVTGFVGMFTDIGLSAATIQRPRITPPQVSTLFWLNVGLGAAAAVVTALCAPLIAWSFGEPRLTGLALVSSGTFLIAGATVQHQSLLRRQHRFVAVTAATVAGAAVATCAAVAFALLGWGVWALVIGSVMQSLTILAVTVWNLPWRPGGWASDPADRAAVRDMLKFGLHLGGVDALVYCRRNLDSLLIGGAFGPATLGLYNKSFQLLSMPMQNVNGPISRVVQPHLARLTADPAAFRRLYRQAVFAVVALNLPIAAFAAVNADEIILTALGPNWTEAVPMFQAMIPAAIVGPLNCIANWGFLPYGRSARSLKTQAWASVLIITGITSGLAFGPIGVAWGFGAGYAISMPLTVRASLRGTPVRILDVWSGVWPCVAAASAATSTLHVLGLVGFEGWSPIPAIDLLQKMAVFGLIYILTHLIMPSRRVWPRMSRFLVLPFGRSVSDRIGSKGRSAA